MIERAENGPPRACANCTGPSGLKWPVGSPEAGGGSFRVLTGDPHPLGQC
jgi:hypothetical protein